jgi:glutamate-ammonia-ligase adenylyltransferase
VETTADIPAPLRGSVERFWERATGVPQDQHAALSRAIAGSEFIAASLIQDPGALAWVLRHDAPQAAAAGNAAYELEVTGAQAERVLREWRRREMLRIAWRDIAGRADVVETLHAVSDLADACIRAAARAAREVLEPVFGHLAADLIVIGMGKLGGRELNFSSDVDLIFLYPPAGETTGPRVIASDDYFNRLGRELIRLLDMRTEDGFVFRVDMRLRPFGDSGPLAVSVASLEDYLQEHGRDWERYAWIKARPIVGAEYYSQVYASAVRPFVFRRYLDFGVFESLRAMKALIERDVARRELDQDLKLGSGGIREIEFIVQSLQLVRGGSDRRLQSAALLELLPLLADSRLIGAVEIDELRAAYLILRKAENALQMIRDAQVHSIPEDPVDRARLAWNMGEPGWNRARERIDAARDAVARIFESQLFGAPQAGRRAEEAGAAWLDSPQAAIADELAVFGLPPSALPDIAALLEAYRQAAPYRRLDEVGHRRVHVILDRLLKAAAQQVEPATVVRRVLRVIEAIGARASYLALLKEQPPALDRLIEICAISGFLAGQIADFPLLLDELIDAKAFDTLPSRATFVAELAARTERLPSADEERQVEALRQFQKIAVFNVALADFTARLPLMRVSDRLTDIAELIVERCTHLAWSQMTAVYGVPYCGEDEQVLRPVAIAVAAYGKFGGLELGYASDLDLVFLHDSRGAMQITRGDKPLDNSVFLLRLGQRIVHLLTMHSAAGRLYEVDMRLRPNGKSGFLMTGIDAFERYQMQEAWTWEHQALLRARAVAGDAALCGSFEAARRAILGSAVRRDTLRADVAGMRMRMRRELSHGSRGAHPRFDIKQDAGGIADIEFLVQYLVLANADRHPQLLVFTDNVRQLEGLAAAGVLDTDTALLLTGTYVEYRRVLHHLSLEVEGEPVVDAAPFESMRAAVRAIWQAVFD